jgi:GNAT superfamily N-acetyltransferase
MNFEIHSGNYLLSDDPTRLDVDAVHLYLSTESYWSKDIPRATVETALRNSLCIGCYRADGGQVGLIRAVTDYATYAWLCDVFVLPPDRGHGLGKALVQAALAHPKLQGLRRIGLATQDAHTLYSQFGFRPLADPRRHLEKRNPHAYLPAPNVAPITPPLR